MTKEWIPTARGLAMTNVARHGATLIPSLRAQRGNPRRWFIHPWIATACGLAMTTRWPVMARSSFRHCERSAAIHGVGSSPMDRHGLRPRDDDEVAGYGTEFIPSLRAQRGNPRRWFIHHGSPRPAASR
jgi:hypothetical protein